MQQHVGGVVARRMWVLLSYLFCFQHWKHFENRSIFGTAITDILYLPFFETQCMSHLNLLQSKTFHSTKISACGSMSTWYTSSIRILVLSQTTLHYDLHQSSIAALQNVHFRKHHVCTNAHTCKSTITYCFIRPFHFCCCCRCCCCCRWRNK